MDEQRVSVTMGGELAAAIRHGGRRRGLPAVGMGGAHWQRKADMHATRDAQFWGWMQQQAQSDASHAT